MYGWCLFTAYECRVEPANVGLAAEGGRKRVKDKYTTDLERTNTEQPESSFGEC